MQAAIASAPVKGMLPLRTASRFPAGASPRAAGCGCGCKHGLVAPVRRTQLVRATQKEEGAVEALGAACSIDDMSNCSLADLETMYVNALWSFYSGEGNVKITNEQYDRLKEELSWQGSGFPTLKRDEIKFVQASIEYQKGNKILEDAEFDALKTKILSKSAKRSDVTALLLAVKGQEMLDPEEYEKLKQDMINLGIDVGLKGASCTLSNTSEELNTDFESLLIMYGGLSALPFLGGSVIWWLANLILPGDLPVSTYFGFVGLFTATIVTIILNVAELWNGSIYAGQCPCCESKVSAFFGSTTDSVSKRKCQVCGTALTIDSNSMKLSLQDGPKYLA
mmetsp:Transcript_13431/g.38139  ORF Transcript_13431/g.38139 Transcript_13431/m.38139 type:complete len:337 (-) Transcript_13431:218-1228(-)|eukprot:CAMPEP_0117668030 /NCGR_PEP_ID=MMETSP0804-20121206/11303_1 /TAXON_ID=1074897 /ORGANISM="Tetraselmis astigmatica, Strain CCMP880" /LENGTH=336 /DNA_ID=CAMNT_0005475837 /DNA_START=114 /DNA_END=1124 /DNA_ORIENTATION=-